MANLSGFGIGNFKAIDDYQWIELAPITVLVGPNGSGKSSLVQAMIMFDDTIHSHRQYWNNIIHRKPLEDNLAFDVEYFDDYYLDQFSSFDNLFSGKFNLSKDAARQFANINNRSNKITFKSHYIIDIELVYSFSSLRELKISGKNNIIYTYINLDSKEIIINWHHIKEYLVNEIDHVIWMERSEDNFPPAGTSVLYSSLLWSKIINGDGKFSLDFHNINHDKIEEYTNRFKIEFGEEEDKDIWNSIGNLVNTVFHGPKKDNTFFKSYYIFLSAVFYYYIDSNKYSYHPCTLEKLDKIINRNTDKKFNELIFKFANDVRRNTKNGAYLKKWLIEFGIADGYEINNLYESYVEFLLLKGDKKLNISEIGFGNMQIIKLLLEINNSSTNVIIEEPETNLHPKYQSKLADLFIDAIKNNRAKFIIETHSEYLVRKLQYLIAKKEVKTNDIVIYYFHHPDEIPKGEKQIKKLTIREDGMMDGDFGEGFFDESARLTMDLLKIQSQN